MNNTIIETSKDKEDKEDKEVEDVKTTVKEEERQEPAKDEKTSNDASNLQEEFKTLQKKLSASQSWGHKKNIAYVNAKKKMGEFLNKLCENSLLEEAEVSEAMGYFNLKDDNSRDVFDIDKATIELADKLDIKKIKTEERTDRLLIQEILRKLMLRYLIDIDRKTKLKQGNIENHYPTDLINSLKTIADLYFKIKESNKHLRDDDDQSIF